MAAARVTVRHRAAFLVRREHPAVRALALAGLVMLWELFTRLGWVPALFLPSPFGVLAEVGDMARSGQLSSTWGEPRGLLAASPSAPRRASRWACSSASSRSPVAGHR